MLPNIPRPKKWEPSQTLYGQSSHDLRTLKWWALKQTCRHKANQMSCGSCSFMAWSIFYIPQCLCYVICPSYLVIYLADLACADHGNHCFWPMITMVRLCASVSPLLWVSPLIPSLPVSVRASSPPHPLPRLFSCNMQQIYMYPLRITLPLTTVCVFFFNYKH